MTHEELKAICKNLEQDYAPYGGVDRQEVGSPAQFGPDCSWDCCFFHPLRGREGMDWGVCCNPLSHRNGLLTFEHQGCIEFTTPSGTWRDAMWEEGEK